LLAAVFRRFGTYYWSHLQGSSGFTSEEGTHRFSRNVGN
jgi:hypothetical protein